MMFAKVIEVCSSILTKEKEMRLKVVLGFIAISMGSLVHAQPIASSKAEISCGSFYQCLDESAIKALSGKTIRYRHPAGSDFGDVILQLKSDGTASASNKKGSAGDGPWEAKNGVLNVNFSSWGAQAFRFVRIGNQQVFLHSSRGGSSALIPVEISDK
jgi:hypothetical protein